MPETKYESVADLRLDLRNFRTVPQQDEAQAINAVAGTNPTKFWALTESLIEDGYHPTENLIVVRDGGHLCVKEGNRRVAGLKLILGLTDCIDVPENLSERIQTLTPDWKKRNSSVPCAIYGASEAETVDKLVALTHAKGEKAGRDKWTAVARARYSRDQKKDSEPGLDLLESYLRHGKNLSPQQAEQWAGDYPLTVLDEALQKLVPFLKAASANEIAHAYPARNKRLLDRILYDIGTCHLGFKQLRDGGAFFESEYGVRMPPTSPTGASGGNESGASAGQSTTKTPAEKSGRPARTAALASNDPKAVRRCLRSFSPRGNGRGKLVTLLNEAKDLNVEKYPHAFCFLLRSMFELSAKAYCADHAATGGPKAEKANGEDRHLVEVLKEIADHITQHDADKAKTRLLHGAKTELARAEGLLSVTSMNQLVHNRHFSVKPSDISLLFGNIFPLLEEMNR